MRVLGLVPARGGSKGIPRKNLVPFLGVPLVGRAVRSGLDSTALAKVVVSTDDVEIAEVAKRFGAWVPFRRSAELAADEAPTLGVVQHALAALAELGERFDAVCLLQPTNPLRLPEDVDGACKLLAGSDASAVVSVERVPHAYHPYWAYLTDEEGVLRLAVSGPVVPRRQELPTAWVREGAVYVTRTSVVLEEGSLYGSRVLAYRMPSDRSGNIDTPEDLAYLEARARALGWADESVGSEG